MGKARMSPPDEPNRSLPLVGRQSLRIIELVGYHRLDGEQHIVPGEGYPPEWCIAMKDRGQPPYKIWRLRFKRTSRYNGSARIYEFDPDCI